MIKPYNEETKGARIFVYIKLNAEFIIGIEYKWIHVIFLELFSSMYSEVLAIEDYQVLKS